MFIIYDNNFENKKWEDIWNLVQKYFILFLKKSVHIAIDVAVLELIILSISAKHFSFTLRLVYYLGANNP